MPKKTFAEYRNNKKNKQSKMRKIRNYLKSANKKTSENQLSDINERNNYRSGSRERNPEKEMFLFKMMIRSRENKLKKIGNRKYKLKN
ncbi:hypothetical protein SAMN04488598_10675 [Halanaerobium congolense]|uniref:Uncharacterized protein n=1 Tax=Halanaerobium congolense TaxID=54121 RepID=A0A1G7IG07_9FIRM|nr:hypothetical protein [Halanaerobium congolense]KXS49577.1 MAG: hypothetical protein AWL62_907 [Halanaerobium sp. T82-1]OEG63259.1 MAG: hypothetical protein BHK79_05690 [Halanaerobium sp. MDAL1]PUU93598.1 MAG: hypothetical protein CI948_40 [Halanaerobium sp.]PTX17289.1 hypothetical protein C7953_2061 [Halanaerobium congolense]SDF11573.1 hypothetical protein SAMN04488598_10675 [Halanaerobium congolense]